MSSFNIQVGENQYEIEFTRDSVRKFEAMGGSINNAREKIQTSTDVLFYLGLITHNPTINPNLAQKICDKAIDEYGLGEVYSTLIDPFTEVFMQAGKKPAGKTLRVTPKETETV
ncbi:hypothetical protein ACRQV7_02990 [Caproiciproducens sp. R2]|uniref:hypothetical protein n=1 Tax=Caproiciproducens sp. R2 TaxID=3435187 RepID=UPI004033CF2C